MSRRRPELTLLQGGADDAALPRLQADFPGYVILPSRDCGRGLVPIAVRKPGADGPLVVMAEDADEMRRVLSAFCNSCP
jgi:hypothetical protein